MIHDEKPKAETGTDDEKESNSPTSNQGDGETPHLTHEDVEALRQTIEEGKLPIKFDSPLALAKRQRQ